MQKFEYKVVPAPTGGTKAKGVKTVEGRFANTLEVLMNKMATDGWEFQRAETLPSEERAGLMSKSTTYRNVLVFRRGLELEQPVADVPVILPVAELDPTQDQQPEPEIEVAAVEETVHDTIVDPAVEDEDAQAPQPLVAQRD